MSCLRSAHRCDVSASTRGAKGRRQVSLLSDNGRRRNLPRQRDNLGQIANCHLVWADRRKEGVRSEECLRLAKLQSSAVDFAKTGVAAEFPGCGPRSRSRLFGVASFSYPEEKAFSLSPCPPLDSALTVRCVFPAASCATRTGPTGCGRRTDPPTRPQRRAQRGGIPHFRSLLSRAPATNVPAHPCMLKPKTCPSSVLPIPPQVIGQLYDEAESAHRERADDEPGAAAAGGETTGAAAGAGGAFAYTFDEDLRVEGWERYRESAVRAKCAQFLAPLRPPLGAFYSFSSLLEPAFAATCSLIAAQIDDDSSLGPLALRPILSPPPPHRTA